MPSEPAQEPSQPIEPSQHPTPAQPATVTVAAPEATRTRTNGHRVPYEPRCPVCVDPGRPELEHDYVNGMDWAVLLDWADGAYNKTQIERHMAALDFDVERTKNTYKVMHVLMEKGLERVEAGLEAVTPDHMIKLIPHIDKREGRIIERVKVDAPRQIVINAPNGLPLPGLQREELAEPAIAGRLIEEEIPLMLPQKKD